MNRSSSRSSASRKSPSNVRSSAKTKRRRKHESGSAASTELAELKGTADESGGDTDVVRDGFLLDFISGTKEVKETPKELVRQRIARALFHEYGISVDAKGAAYQEIVGTNLRGDRGQYFTPRGAIRLVVEILGPKEEERLLDPACGTGGFLVAALAHRMERFRKEERISAETESSEEFESLNQRLRRYASKQVFGCDFDPFLIRARQMNMVMAGDGKGHLYHLNSLEFPAGHLDGVRSARRAAPLGSVDVVMTNPPFGSSIPITDENILEPFELAQIWERTEDGGFRKTGRLQGSVAPEVLFIERSLDWLKPGGRMGIVLPDGILGNPAAEYIRWWILRHAWVLASVDLPVETFIVEANVNILTSLLFLKKKPDEVVSREGTDQNAAIHLYTHERACPEARSARGRGVSNNARARQRPWISAVSARADSRAA